MAFDKYSAFLVIMLASAASPAASSDKATGSFSIGASIPVNCALAANTFEVSSEGTVIRGTVSEACNTNRGFSVVAFHRPLSPGEQITVRYGSNVSGLTQNGYSVIGYRAGPRVGEVPVTIRTGSISKPLAISFAFAAF